MRLANYELLPIAKCKSINSDLIGVDRNDLSNEQKIVFEILQAVSTGACSIALSRASPGPILQARWIITASRILRFCVGTQETFQNLS